ncbi:MAG: hypothetical protein NTV63_05165 [Candidatus Woesearchaeota archaeon]|nr:hypothetical protein [Candidatus Woesearchaeota archaeon]
MVKTIGKSGFVKILEVFFAIMIAFTFLVFIMPGITRTEPEEQEVRVLEMLIENSTFRGYVLSEENDSVNISIGNELIKENLRQYNYTFTISENPLFFSNALPNKEVIVYSAFVASNSTFYSPKALRLYLWKTE